MPVPIGMRLGLRDGAGGREVAVQKTEVDGVPTVWAPSEGELTAGLVFRVGRADETWARSGITHLVEHLALHASERPYVSQNGIVGASTHDVPRLRRQRRGRVVPQRGVPGPAGAASRPARRGAGHPAHRGGPAVRLESPVRWRRCGAGHSPMV